MGSEAVGLPASKCVISVEARCPPAEEPITPIRAGSMPILAASARTMPGSGLGLAIVAQTAAQHGGTVTAAPNAPHGTVITIRGTGFSDGDDGQCQL